MGQETTRFPLSSNTQISSPKDSIASDSVIVANEGGVVEMIDYSSEDSIIFLLGEKKLELYGAGRLNYGNIRVRSQRMRLSWEKSLLEAWTPPDSTGARKRRTQYTQDKTYYARGIAYNLRSERARADGIVTKEKQETFLLGNDVLVEKDGDLYVKNCSYTTCNKEHPHFSIESNRVKVVGGRRVVTGPFYLRIGGSNLPLGFLFGIFPRPNQKASGIIAPVYGEEKRRGFFLRNLGYYFAFNDYMDLEVRTDIYSKGSFGLYTQWNYIHRYLFEGNMDLRYTRTRAGTILSPNIADDFWIMWRHRSKSKGSRQFSAEVNAGTRTFTQNNFINTTSNTNTQFSSNIQYSHRFSGTPFSMNVSLRHSQNVQQNTLTLSLPEGSLHTRRQYPFQWFSSNSRSIWSRLGFSHNLLFRNEISNVLFDGRKIPLDSDNLGELFYQSRNGVQQNVDMSMPVTVARYITWTPSVSYRELWYFRRLDHRYDAARGGVVADTIQGFSRAGNYGVSSTVSTQLFGTFFFKGRLQAIRHTFRPSISISYNPDFSKTPGSVYQNVTFPDGRVEAFSPFRGFLFGSPPASASGSASIQLSNQFEMKLRSRKDSTESIKYPLLSNLNIATQYNFLADSLHLSRINIEARANYPNIGNFSTRLTLDPYLWTGEEGTVDARRTRFLAWENGKLGQITQWNLSVGTSFSNKKAKEASTPLSSAPPPYLPFHIPWTFSINYALNLTRSPTQGSHWVQSVTGSSTLSLTKTLSTSVRTGYNISTQEFTLTSFTFNKDFHCWELTGSWIPFGHFTSYQVTFRAKSLLLQPVRIRRQRSFFDTDI